MGKKIQQNNKKKTVIMVAVLSILILFGLWLAGTYQVRKDADRFKDAETNLLTVFDGLVQKIGTPIQTETKNVCYNSQQGPYDDGNLWCQVAAAAYFPNSDIPETQIRTYFEAVIASSGYTVHSGAGDAFFYAADKLGCNLVIYSGVLATSPGYYFTNVVQAKQTILLVCADESRAKHYQYQTPS